jgi:DNA-binding GntR family transcriptional regulator
VLGREVDDVAGQPRWQEIADDLNSRIQADEFGAEDGQEAQLPKEADLCEEYNASRNTVREAVGWLADRGIVRTERGRGTYVIPRPEPIEVTLSSREITEGGGEGAAYVRQLVKLGREAYRTSPRVEIQQASEPVARYLQIGEDEQVVLRHQQGYITKDPWFLQTSFYPLSFVRDGATRLLEATDIGEGTVKYLQAKLGYKQAGYHDEISARRPDEIEEAFFKLSGPSATVLETYRTSYDADGRPFRLTVTVWPADRNRLHYNIGEVPEPVVHTPGEQPPPQD